jgi:Ca2+-binding RTX toxin-like protein
MIKIPFNAANGEVSSFGKKPRAPGAFSEANEASDPLTADLANDQFGLAGQGPGFASGVNPMLFAETLRPTVAAVAPIAEPTAASINAFVGGQAILSDGSMLGNGMAATNFVRVDDNSDQALNGDIARANYGVDGSGLKIGILSDTFNRFGGAAADVANGDLPASGVTVLEEGPLSGPDAGEDEGRAMAQLVHRIAPGAQLYFHTAFNSEADFAQGIRDLAAAGAKIIVDDVTYFDEPFFQDGGLIQTAVEDVAAQGVTYVTAASNEGRNFYEHAFNPVTTTLPGGVGTRTAQNFGGGNALQSITILSGQSVTIDLQWDQPFASIGSGHSSTNSLALYLFDSNGNLVTKGTANQVGGDPIQLIQLTNSTSSTSFRLAIVQNGGATAPGLFKYIIYSPSAGASINDPNAGIGSGSVIGHEMIAAAASVGATYWGSTPRFGANPPQIESFSAVGPGEILFDAQGNRLATPITNNKVDFVATDGSATSVFNPFFGTSAAAPGAAAVAALMLQANTSLTPQDVDNLLKDSSLDMGTSGADTTTGSGLIQADRAVGYASSLTISDFAGSDDVLLGTHLNDTLLGDAGNETLIGGAGNNTLDGGGGINTASYASAPAGAVVNLATGTASNGYGGIDTLSNIENVTGTAYNDTVVLGTGSHTLDGGAGTNILDYSAVGGTNTVTINANLVSIGVLQLSGSVANGSGGTDQYTNFQVFKGGAGNDTFRASPAGNYTIDGGAGVNTLDWSGTGTAATVNFASGSFGVSNGGTRTFSNIQIFRGTSGDTFVGAAGNHTIVGSVNGGETLDYSAATGAATINLSTGAAITGFGGTDQITGVGTVKTGSGNDTFVGGAGYHFLDGGAGNNTLDYSNATSGLVVAFSTFSSVAHWGAGSGGLSYQELENFRNIQTIKGSAFDDTFTDDTFGSEINLGETIDGGGGVNTLDESAPGGLTVNVATGIITKAFSAATSRFSNFQIIDGSSSDTVIGGSGSHTFSQFGTVDYSAAQGAVSVNLSAGTAANGFGGTDTLLGIENARGSAFNDTLIGDANNNVLAGGAGNNTLDGAGGVNTADYSAAVSGVAVNLAAGTAANGYGGTDTLLNIANVIGSAFNDTLTGGAGTETLTGGAGSDTLIGGAGNNLLRGGSGNNVLIGGSGITTADYSDQTFYAGATSGVLVNLATGRATNGYGGTDTLTGIANIVGSDFNDTLIGDANNNTFNGGTGNNLLDGGGGINTVDYSWAPSATRVDLASGTVTRYNPLTLGYDTDTLRNIQNVIGTNYGDTLIGDANGNVLKGGSNNDILAGGGGNNTLDGGGGVNTADYSFAPGAVTVNLATGNASNGYGGSDTLLNIENVTGTAFDDTLIGDAGNNVLRGGVGGNDTFDGGAGNNALVGSFNVLLGVMGINTADYSSDPGAVTVFLASNYAYNGYGGTDTLVNIQNVTGSAFGDTLFGDNRDNVLSGGAGNDTLFGGAGNNTLDGGTGTNTADYANAPAGVVVNLAAGTASNGYGGTDTLRSIQNVYGSAFADTLTGDANDNVFYGFGGNDTLIGGGGNDTAIFDGFASGYVIYNSVSTGALTVQDLNTLSNGSGTDTLFGIANLQFSDRTISNVPQALSAVAQTGIGQGVAWKLAGFGGVGGLTYGLQTGSAHGVAVVNADGTFSYTPNAGYSGSDSFVYRVTDSRPMSTTATVAIGVGSSNTIGSSKSLQFSASGPDYLSATPGVAGNGGTTTLSFWFKRSSDLNQMRLFSTGGGGVETEVILDVSGGLRVEAWGPGGPGRGYYYEKLTSAKFQDPTVWNNVVEVLDTGNAVAGDRVRLYLNGTRLTSFAASIDPAQGYQSSWNAASPLYIGTYWNYRADQFDGQLADVNLVDGQALAPSAFGGLTPGGQWAAQQYTGTYGTNGFHLDFANAANAGSVGADSSGRGNGFTASGLGPSALVASGPAVLVPAVTLGGTSGNDVLLGGRATTR